MYQPPWQYPEVLQKITTECYSWLTNWLATTDENLKISLNMNYSLTQLLIEHKLENIIDNIGRGVERGKIELTGSAAYHAFLPLLPESEIKRQIELNHKGNEEVFGSLWQPKGFFPPEMGFSSDLAKIIKEMGYKWTITDAPVFSAHNDKPIPHNYIASIHGLPVFFRAKVPSTDFAMTRPDSGDTNTEAFILELNKELKSRFGDQSAYTCLSFDIETIGHHQNYTENSMIYLARTIEDVGLESAHFSDILSKFHNVDLLDVEKYKGSWSTEPYEIHQGIPYPLWKHPDNNVHKLQRDLESYALGLIRNIGEDTPIYQEVRDELDQSLNSCKFWWATPGRWNKDLVLDGTLGLVGTVRKMENYLQDKCANILSLPKSFEVQSFSKSTYELLESIVNG